MQGLSFLYPWLLLGLLFLPLLWRFLRFNPPKPVREAFTYVYLLKLLKQDEKVAYKAPLWLLIFRILLAALLIIIFAHPYFVKKPLELTPKHDLLLLIDNGFGSKANWPLIKEKANQLLEKAQLDQKHVYFVPLISEHKTFLQAIKTPISGKEAEKKLAALEIYPLTLERLTKFQTLANFFENQPKHFDIVYFSDGLKTKQDEAAFLALNKIKFTKFFVQFYQDQKLYALTDLERHANNFQLSIKRLKNDPLTLKAASINLTAFDNKGHVVAKSQANFLPHKATSHASFSLPLELSNKIISIKIDNQANAAGVYLLGNEYQQKRVALFSPPLSEIQNPLLSPFYYIAKALDNKSEMIYTKRDSFSKNLSTILNQNPDILFLDDRILDENPDTKKLENFVEKGGILIRFAGPRLASAPQKDKLLPINLYPRIRVLDGKFSVGHFLKIGHFSKISPFNKDMPFHTIKIFRQILPQPEQNLDGKILAYLEDGTPFISTSTVGQGRIIFIHSSLNEKWSNLALDPFFLPMLETFLNLPTAKKSPLVQKPIQQDLDKKLKFLHPWRLVDNNGELTIDTRKAQPIKIDEIHTIHPDIYHPIGLYGTIEALYPLNLFTKDQNLEELVIPKTLKIELEKNDGKPQNNFWPFLILIGFLWFLLDSSLIFLQRHFPFQVFSKIWQKMKFFSFIISLFVSFSVLYAFFSNMPAIAMAKIDQSDIQAAQKTHFAYVKSKNEDLNETAQLGLDALADFIYNRTTISPAKTKALDLENDELAFYPLIYWPIDENEDLPSAKALEKINFYMQHGGTILFDSGDQLEKESFLNENQTSKRAKKLQAILRYLDVPPLAKVTKDNVLSHSFYIMPNFPGLYSQSPLWTVSQTDPEQKEMLEQRDGVSPILITANNLAAAWAKYPNGEYKYPLIEDQINQRLWAYRGGLNLLLYVLTGSYKKDQFHVDALLNRTKNKWDYQ